MVHWSFQKDLWLEISILNLVWLGIALIRQSYLEDVHLAWDNQFLS